MKISNTPGVSFLLRAIENFRRAQPQSDSLTSSIQFKLEGSLSTPFSLVDRSIAPLSSAPILQSEDLLPIKESASSNVVFKQIIAPIFRLLKKAHLSRPEELKSPKLTVTTIVLTGAALVSACVVITFVLRYFFSRPAPKKPDAPPSPSPQQGAPASNAALSPVSPPAIASSASRISPPPPSPKQELQSGAPASQPALRPASPLAVASPALGIPPPPPSVLASPARSPEIPASQTNLAAGTEVKPAPASEFHSNEIDTEAAVPLGSSDGAPLAAPAPIPLPVPPPVDGTESIAKPPTGKSPPPVKANVLRSSPPSSSPSPPAQAESPPKPKSWLQRLGGAILRSVFPTRHFSKWKKYRIIQELLQKFSSGKLPSKVINPDASHIATAWNTLVETLNNPDKEKTADEQYRSIIEALRKTASLLLSAEEKIKKQFEPQLKFVKELSYFRFAGVGLFKYCRELVELVTGTELPSDLSLDTFQQTLKSLISRLDRPDDEHSMNPLAREAKKLSGTVNVAFDPLLQDNVPYLDGQLGINGKSIRILRHGVPFYHNDPYGLVGALAGRIPIVKWYVNRDNMSTEPVLNADYVAFILAAGDRGENIFQTILENGQVKLIGDESPRVRGRLKLILIHKNFFAVAFREDGHFFEREDLPSKTAKEPLNHLKERLEQQLLPLKYATKPDEKPLSDEQLLDKMFAQLEETGFCIPDKVIEKSDLRQHIKPLLQEVEDIYFLGCKEIESVPEHQAFIMLSYAHIVLFLCIRLDISILEAFCKDDIDRGNAFKTILKLHYLYLTGQISAESLLNILVNTLAAPFIVKKQAIIPSRLVLIEHVLPIMQRAFERLPRPKTMIFGVNMANPFYDVFATVGQTIYPDNLNAKNIEEYLAFLEARPIELPRLTDNLIETTAKKIQDNQTRKDLILRSAKALNLHVDGELLKPRAGATEEQISNIPWERIISLLTLRAGLPSEEAWKIASCIQLDFHQPLYQVLELTFNNQGLNLSVELDSEAMNKTPETGISLDVGEDKVVRLKFDLLYKIVEDKPGIVPSPVIARMKASITIPDHRTGQAQFDWSLIR